MRVSQILYYLLHHIRVENIFMKQKQIEIKYQKPLAEVLLELHAQFGSLKAVAAELGVTPSVATYYVAREGLELKQVLVRRGQEVGNV